MQARTRQSGCDDSQANGTPEKPTNGRGRNGRFLLGNRFGASGRAGKESRAGRWPLISFDEVFREHATPKATRDIVRAIIKKAEAGDPWAVKVFLEWLQIAEAARAADPKRETYFETLSPEQRRRLDRCLDSGLGAVEGGEEDDVDKINTAKLVSSRPLFGTTLGHSLRET